MTAVGTPCIEWPRSRGGGGYGQSYALGRRNKRQAHRLAWEQVHGPIPDGLVVMHLCDNPPCVNVDHLRLGTQSENMRDCSAKGRLSPPPRRFQRGEASSTARLTWDDVTAIRRRYAEGGVSQSSLASAFGISQVQVWRILRGLRWQ